MATPRRRPSPPPPRTPVIAASSSKLTDEEAEEVRRELVRICGSEDFEGLNLKQVIEVARADPNNVLHKHFTWDVQKAAMKCWLMEARRLIKAVRVEITTYEGMRAEVREIVSVKSVDPRNQTRAYNGFLSRAQVLARPETKSQIIERALEQLRQWCLHVGDVQELTQHRQAILALPGVRQA